MKIKIKKVKDDDFIKINNDAGLEIYLSNLGASIYYIKFNGTFMTISPMNESEFLSSLSYFGKSVGRVAGRIKGAKIDIEGKSYPLEANENNNTLHGGIHNFSFVRWAYKIKELKNLVSVTFCYLSKDLEAGFPGKIATTITYKIYKNNPSFRIEFSAKTNKTSLLNLTNHSYFNLSKYDHDILRHELLIKSSNYALMDEELIVNGYAPISEPLDFRVFKKIGEDILDPSLQEHHSKGYDHNLIFDTPANTSPKIILKSESYQMEIYTDYPNVVIYSDNYPSGVALINGVIEDKYYGLAIEPQLIPGRFDQMIISKKRPYNKFIEYAFSEVKGKTK